LRVTTPWADVRAGSRCARVYLCVCLYTQLAGFSQCARTLKSTTG
jgi:hypothetical protein